MPKPVYYTMAKQERETKMCEWCGDWTSNWRMVDWKPPSVPSKNIVPTR